MKKNLYVIDAYNLIYRMFYAIPEMHTRDGEIVNAVFGVVKFIKSLTEMSPDDHIVIASESGSNFREALYTEYKGTRDRMPDNLRSQIEKIFSFFTCSGIPVLVREGYEADDIIGSIAHDPDGYDEIIIISSDKDLCQFVVDGKVRIFDAMKQKNMRRADVIEKFGVPPEQVKDYLSIVGDSSDNIPGIAGFGPKKAVDLLTKYDTLEGIYDHIGDLTSKMQEILIDQKENAFLSQKLASIVTNLDISIEQVHALDLREVFRKSEVIDFLKKYEFRSLVPAEYREEKIKLSHESLILIDVLSSLDTLMSIISEHPSVILTTVDDQYIALAVGDKAYKIALLSVDTTEFFRFLFEEYDGMIRGYDLKSDLKKILSKNIPQYKAEGQEVLF